MVEKMKITSNFWTALDELVYNSEIIIDRPKGSALLTLFLDIYIGLHEWDLLVIIYKNIFIITLLLTVNNIYANIIIYYYIKTFRIEFLVHLKNEFRMFL